jgi:2-amino-4-hydroxy-6-hydroxymethyldihydropteridine diphosphokinase
MPDWAEASPRRREHALRVADLMGSWAVDLGLDAVGVDRWRAAGLLHDALRDADPEGLRSRVSPDLRDLPAFVLHGPAAAERLRVDGVADGGLLRAVAYHTLGHASLDALGKALYAADFLEPGRDFLNDWRADLRARVPTELDAVVMEVLAARIAHLIERGRPVRSETMGFWNSMAREG